jgi:hypothetical protein
MPKLQDRHSEADLHGGDEQTVVDTELDERLLFSKPVSKARQERVERGVPQIRPIGKTQRVGQEEPARHLPMLQPTGPRRWQ